MSKVRHQAGKQADNRQVSADRQTPTSSSRGEESFELRGRGRGVTEGGEGGMKEYICYRGMPELSWRREMVTSLPNPSS